MQNEIPDLLHKIPQGGIITIYEGDLEFAYENKRYYKGGGFILLDSFLVSHYIGYIYYDRKRKRIVRPSSNPEIVKYPMRGYLPCRNIEDILYDRIFGSYAIKARFKYLNVFFKETPYSQFCVEDPKTKIPLKILINPENI